MVIVKRIIVEFETTSANEDEVIPEYCTFENGGWRFEGGFNRVVSSLLPVLHEVWVVMRNWTKDKNAGSTPKKNP